jgi:hypothetical protein
MRKRTLTTSFCPLLLIHVAICSTASLPQADRSGPAEAIGALVVKRLKSMRRSVEKETFFFIA